MNFTIGNDFLIRGTRGETGTIHITFDSDMTGTKGVFLVKKTPETPDEAAYLVKKFTFGSNPSISGREVVISIVPDDTRFIPMGPPDSPYVFESDYRDIKSTDYVWSIKVYGDDATEMLIPGEGMKYPTFRLYNDAVADRGGRPVVPEVHHRKHHDDMFVTKRDLLHYATMDGRRYDAALSGIETNEADIKQLNRSVLDLYQRVDDSSSQSDNKLSALELKVETNATSVARIQTNVDEMNDAIDDFADKFEEAGDFVHGVRSDRTFTSNRWADTPSWMLGATAAKTIQVVGKDCVSVDTAVDKLFEADDALAEKISNASKTASDQISSLSTSIGTLSSDAQTMDEALSESIAQLKILVGNGTETVQASVSELSGNARTADDKLAGDIKALNQGTSVLCQALGTAISNLSGNAKTNDETLAKRITDLNTLVSNSIADTSSSITTLSGSARTADENLSQSIADLKTLVGSGTDTVQASVTELSGNARIADEALETHIGSVQTSINSIVDTLSGNAQTADETLATSISTLSGNVTTADDAVVAQITTLSGNSLAADETLAAAILTLSGNAQIADAAVAAQITTVVSDYVKKDMISTELAAGSDNDHVPGALAAYNFVNSSINNFAAFYITKNSTGDSFATKAELTSAITSGEFYNGGTKRVPTKNDYLVVLADESRKTDTGLVPTTRYSFDGKQWAFQYVVNNTSLTQAQVDALNSGVTAAKLTSMNDSISSANTSVSTLSGNASTADETLATSISTLSGYAKTCDVALAKSITELSGVAASVANEWSTSYTTLSGNARKADETLATSISTLSGNASSANIALSNSISTLSGNASAADVALSNRVTALEGTSTSHESRITSLEQGRLFASLEEARLWTKTYVPGLVYAADGSADKSSEYTDKNVLKLVLGVVTKLASSPAYFESQTVANAWVKTFVPNIVLNADGTMMDASAFTDEEVMALVLGIVAKMASNH